ncbi:unnamed protein product [Closterium sp. NIES-65]|nr:unnamed protein product [Closterium sp. NIES-65]
MPLARRHVAAEESLASPSVLRAASSDDPRGMLEGVSMACLVGLVKQLAVLSDCSDPLFCADSASPSAPCSHASRVFEGLAADLAEVASRREQVAARARGLESVVGRIEERILKDSHPLALAYTPGVRWRAHVPTAQQVLLSADRPLVIVTAYQNAAPAPPLQRLHRLLHSPAGDLAEGEDSCGTREVRETGGDWRACDDAQRGGGEAAGEGSDGADGIEGADSQAARAAEILLQLEPQSPPDASSWMAARLLRASLLAPLEESRAEKGDREQWSGDDVDEGLRREDVGEGRDGEKIRGSSYEAQRGEDGGYDEAGRWSEGAGREELRRAYETDHWDEEAGQAEERVTSGEREREVRKEEGGSATSGGGQEGRAGEGAALGWLDVGDGMEFDVTQFVRVLEEEGAEDEEEYMGGAHESPRTTPREDGRDRREERQHGQGEEVEHGKVEVQEDIGEGEMAGTGREEVEEEEGKGERHEARLFLSGDWHSGGGSETSEEVEKGALDAHVGREEEAALDSDEDDAERMDDGQGSSVGDGEAVGKIGLGATQQQQLDKARESNVPGASQQHEHRQQQGEEQREEEQEQEEVHGKDAGDGSTAAVSAGRSAHLHSSSPKDAHALAPHTPHSISPSPTPSSPTPQAPVTSGAAAASPCSSASSCSSVSGRSMSHSVSKSLKDLSVLQQKLRAQRGDVQRLAADSMQLQQWLGLQPHQVLLSPSASPSTSAAAAAAIAFAPSDSAVSAPSDSLSSGHQHGKQPSGAAESFSTGAGISSGSTASSSCSVAGSGGGGDGGGGDGASSSSLTSRPRRFSLGSAAIGAGGGTAGAVSAAALAAAVVAAGGNPVAVAVRRERDVAGSLCVTAANSGEPLAGAADSVTDVDGAAAVSEALNLDGEKEGRSHAGYKGEHGLSVKQSDVTQPSQEGVGPALQKQQQQQQEQEEQEQEQQQQQQQQGKELEKHGGRSGGIEVIRRSASLPAVFQEPDKAEQLCVQENEQGHEHNGEGYGEGEGENNASQGSQAQVSPPHRALSHAHSFAAASDASPFFLPHPLAPSSPPQLPTAASAAEAETHEKEAVESAAAAASFLAGARDRDVLPVNSSTLDYPAPPASQPFGSHSPAPLIVPSPSISSSSTSSSSASAPVPPSVTSARSRLTASPQTAASAHSSPSASSSSTAHSSPSPSTSRLSASVASSTRSPSSSSSSASPSPSCSSSSSYSLLPSSTSRSQAFIHTPSHPRSRTHSFASPSSPSILPVASLSTAPRGKARSSHQHTTPHSPTTSTTRQRAVPHSPNATSAHIPSSVLLPVDTNATGTVAAATAAPLLCASTPNAPPRTSVPSSFPADPSSGVSAALASPSTRQPMPMLSPPFSAMPAAPGSSSAAPLTSTRANSSTHTGKPVPSSLTLLPHAQSPSSPPRHPASSPPAAAATSCTIPTSPITTPSSSLGINSPPPLPSTPPFTSALRSPHAIAKARARALALANSLSLDPPAPPAASAATAAAGPSSSSSKHTHTIAHTHGSSTKAPPTSPSEARSRSPVSHRTYPRHRKSPPASPHALRSPAHPVSPQHDAGGEGRRGRVGGKRGGPFRQRSGEWMGWEEREGEEEGAWSNATEMARAQSEQWERERVRGTGAGAAGKRRDSGVGVGAGRRVSGSGERERDGDGRAEGHGQPLKKQQSGELEVVGIGKGHMEGIRGDGRDHTGKRRDVKLQPVQQGNGYENKREPLVVSVKPARMAVRIPSPSSLAHTSPKPHTPTASHPSPQPYPSSQSYPSSSQPQTLVPPRSLPSPPNQLPTRDPSPSPRSLYPPAPPSPSSASTVSLSSSFIRRLPSPRALPGAPSLASPFAPAAATAAAGSALPAASSNQFSPALVSPRAGSSLLPLASPSYSHTPPASLNHSSSAAPPSSSHSSHFSASQPRPLSSTSKGPDSVTPAATVAGAGMRSGVSSVGASGAGGKWAGSGGSYRSSDGHTPGSVQSHAVGMRGGVGSSSNDRVTGSGGGFSQGKLALHVDGAPVPVQPPSSPLSQIKAAARSLSPLRLHANGRASDQERRRMPIRLFSPS